jgi:hypothetical protein
MGKGEAPIPRIFVEKSKLKELYEIPRIKIKFLKKNPTSRKLRAQQTLANLVTVNPDVG